MNASAFRWSALAAAVMVLTGCSPGPKPGRLAPPAAAVSASEIAAVQDLMMQGDRKRADKHLKALLKREPMNAPLLLLRQSLTGDAHELLGPNNYPYTVRAGDTIEELARRLLGNKLKAYQLARYNRLAPPVTLTPGQTLRIPSMPPQPPKPQAQPAREAAAQPAPTVPKANPALAKPKATLPSAAPAANPVAAQRARAAGLAALNRGVPKEAVRLLQRANTLDPSNAVIRRDLQRAQRIAATVQAQR